MSSASAVRSFHQPVMAAEIAEVFAPVGEGFEASVVVDATLGGGGHAERLLAQHPQRRLLGIDRDPAAIAEARHRLAPFGDRVTFCRASFDKLGELLDAHEIGSMASSTPGSAGSPTALPLVGVLFDFGVSSHQLDSPERGFSHRVDAPLDMRMDPESPVDAAAVVNSYSEADLRSLLVRNADERYAGRIARAICATRPLLTTGQLADVVRAAVPAAARRAKRHPAMRTFAALRIAVNDELSLIEPAIGAALARLSPGGRLATLSYHSGEDRIVKHILRQSADGVCDCPASLPCICGSEPTVKLLRRKVARPTSAEVERNPRAASALMRSAERLAPVNR